MPGGAPESPERRFRSVLRHHAARLGSAVLVCAMVLAALAFGRASLSGAQDERLTERANLVRQLLSYAEGSYDPATLVTLAGHLPFDQRDPQLNRSLLANFMVASTGDQAACAALLRIDDGTVAAYRPTASPPPTVAELGTAWQKARGGSPARSTVFGYEGKPAIALTLPIGGPDPWAVLVVTQELAGTSSQRFVRDLGSLGQGRGGISLLDAEGHSIASFDPTLLGKGQVNRQLIASLPPDSTRWITTGRGSEELTTVLVRRGDLVGTFQQPTAELFADLTAGQQQRDLALLGILLLALVAVLTTSIRQVRAARRERNRTHALLAGAHDLILVVADDGNLSFVSPNLPQLLGHQVDAWTGGRLQDHLHPDDVPRLGRLLADPDGIQTTRDVRFRAPDGSYHWFDVEAGDLSGERLVSGVLLTCRDTGGRKDLEDKLFEQARRDPLTGLANRAVLAREVSTRLSGVGTAAVTLLFIDLDGFKQVNDAHGHEAGDQLLQVTAERLRSAAGEGELVARYGGDEFVVVLSTGEESVARAAADRIGAELGRPVAIGDGVTVQVGSSIGVAVSVTGVRRAEVLVRAADRAMYAAKRAGGGASVAPQVWLTEPEIGCDGADASWEASSPPAVTPSPPEATTSRPDASSRTDRTAVDGRQKPRRPLRHGAPDGQTAAADTGPLVALVATVLAIVAVAGIGLWGAKHAQHAAERQRVTERLEITDRVADYAAALASPDRLRQPVNAAPWQLDGSLVDVLVLQAVLQSDLGGQGAQAGLYRPSGTSLTGDGGPATTQVGPATFPFRTAVSGNVGFIPLIRDGGTAYAGYAIPISRYERVVAVLVIAQPLAHSISEHLLELVGSLGFGRGGLSSVLPDGTVTHSWNPALIGTRIADPQALAPVWSGSPAVLGTSGGTIALAARMDVAAAGYGITAKYIVLEQPTSAFYAGIRDTGNERDFALLGVVLLNLLVIGVAGLHRGRQEQRAHRRLDALLRNAHDIVAVTRQGRINYLSPAVERLLGQRPQERTGTWMLQLVHPADRAAAAKFLGGGAGDTLRDVRLLHTDGTSSWFDVHRTDLSAEPDVGGVVLTWQEIGERKNLRDQLDQLVHLDALTGLPNREKLMAELTRYTAESVPVGVLFVDLDQFKPVNDLYGHEAGDTLLRTVAQRLGGCVHDVPDALAGRLGGDEFAVLLPGDARGSSIVVADRILRALAEPVQLSDGQRPGVSRHVVTGATIGIAQSRAGDSPSTVLRRADQAMYEGKNSGRGRYAVHAG